jgi:hypothetical protein
MATAESENNRVVRGLVDGAALLMKLLPLPPEQMAIPRWRCRHKPVALE